MIARRELLGWSAACLVGVSTAAHVTSANAQVTSFPTQPVRIIVPHPAGGGTDVATRFVAQRLSVLWKQSVIVENMSGAGGNIGAEYVSKAPPDGLTLLMSASGTITVNPSLYSALRFDATKSLMPIALVAPTTFVLVTSPKHPFGSLQEMLQGPIGKSGAISFASSGVGTISHLGGELLRHQTNAPMLHVPYRGGAPALADTIGGTVTFMLADVITAKPHIEAGKLKPLGVSTLQRSPTMQGVSPIAETVPGYDVMGWSGLFGPRGTPAEILQKINVDVNAILRTPEAQSALALNGFNLSRNTPEEFRVLIDKESRQWGALVKAANIQPQ